MRAGNGDRELDRRRQDSLDRWERLHLDPEWDPVSRYKKVRQAVSDKVAPKRRR